MVSNIFEDVHRQMAMQQFQRWSLTTSAMGEHHKTTLLYEQYKICTLRFLTQPPPLELTKGNEGISLQQELKNQ